MSIDTHVHINNDKNESKYCKTWFWVQTRTNPERPRTLRVHGTRARSIVVSLEVLGGKGVTRAGSLVAVSLAYHT